MSHSAGGVEAAPLSTTQSRLWKLGVCLAVMLATAIATSKILGPKTDLIGMPGSDFVPSYMAGTFVRTGHTRWLMDLAKESTFQHQLRENARLDTRRKLGPWLNPPFFAWVFAPLSASPYRQALAGWFGVNLIMSAMAIALLTGMLPQGTGWRRWGLIPLLVCCSFPFLQAIASEQNSCLSLLLLCTTVVCWRTKRAYWAGAIAGLLLFKPQLAAVLIAALCLSLGWQALLGVATTAFGLLTITMLTLPGALRDYLVKLPLALPWATAGGTYLWERQITWLGFFRFLFQYHATGPTPMAVRILWPIGALAVGGMLAVTAIRARHKGVASSDRLIAAVISAMPLVMPYYMDYDLLLLAVPAVLLAAEACGERLDAGGKRLFWGWMAIYVWLFVNAPVAASIHISLIVPALSIMAVAQCMRVLRPRSVRAARSDPDSPMIARFRASLMFTTERAA